MKKFSSSPIKSAGKGRNVPQRHTVPRDQLQPLVDDLWGYEHKYWPRQTDGPKVLRGLTALDAQ